MGKKVIIGIVALLVVAVLALLVTPAFIDWNRYKDQLADVAEESLGRRLTVGGDLSLSLLPLPTLVAGDVRLANAPGARAEDMVRVEEVRVRVSLSALLTGTVQVDSVRLVSPVVTLERHPDGGGNWVFGTPARTVPVNGSRASGPVPGPGPESGAGAEGFALRLNSLEIVDGRVLYSDPGGGVAEEVTGIAGDFSAQTLAGPFRGQGRVTWRGVPVSFEGGLGALDPARAASVSLDLDLLDGAAGLTFSGRLTPAAEGRHPRGDLRLRAERLPAVLAAFGLSEPPPALAQLMVLEGALSVDETEAALDNLSLRLGDVEARGALAAAFGDAVPRVRLDLSASAIDVEKWTKAGPATPASAVVPTVPEAPDPAETAASAAATAGGGPEEDAFAWTRSVEIAADLRAEAVAWRGGVIRQAHLAAGLADGLLTVHELTGQLPGNSTLGVYGTLGADGAAQPRLDLRVEARSDNLRTALDWLGVDVSAVPGGRLTRFEAEARIGGTPAAVQIRNLDATVDTTTLRGAATIVPGSRPAFGLTARVGSLNLDAYLPISPAAAPVSAPEASPQPVEGGAASGEAGESGEAPLFAGLEALNGFDANFRLTVETLTWNGLPLRGVHAEGSLVGGRLTVKDTGVGEALGATLGLNGAVSGFGGVPEFHDLSYALSVPDAARLARAVSLDLPVPGDVLGRISARGTLTGTPGDLGIDTRLEAADAVVSAKGVIDGLGQAGARALAYDLAVSLSHPQTDRLIRLAAPGYQPRGRLGGLDLAAQVSGQAGVAAVSDLRASVGKETLRGNATVDYSRLRPLIQADLTGSRLTLDRFLPAKQQAWLGVPGLVPENGVVQLAAARDRWSSEPMDLSALRAVDAVLSLTSEALVYEVYTLADAELRARLEAGVLTLPTLTGRLFGGALTATAVVDASQDVPGASTDLTLDGVQVGEVLRAFEAGQGATGRGQVTLTATTQGASEEALISALNGEGTLKVSRLVVDRSAVGRGGGQALLGPIIALNQIGALGQADAGTGTLDSRFVIQNGIVRVQTLTLTSSLYAGDFQGTVDLPRWTLDIAGQARMSQNLLTGLLARQLKLPEVVPVAVTGSLDAPRVRVDTGRAPSRQSDGTAQPQRQAPREVLPGLLDQMLGGPSPEAPPAPDGQEKPQAPAKPRPEDMLRGLFKGLGG